MGILDSVGFGKLQEKLLGKSAQNKVVGLKLSKGLVIGRVFDRAVAFCVPEGKPNPIGAPLDDIEDNQINMLGRSRKDYLESIVGQFQRDQAIEAQNNNK